MQKYAGVMDREYAEKRKRSKVLVYRYKMRARELASVLSSPGKESNIINLLDLGSAEGAMLRELSAIMAPIWIKGIEYSSELIDSVGGLPGNISIAQGDITCLPDDVKKMVFDCVSAMAVIEHIEDPLTVFEEVRSVLKDRGRFVLSMPSPFWAKAASKLGLMKGDYHVREFNSDEIIKIAASAAFVLVEQKKFMGLPVAFLPYFGITVDPEFSIGFDSFIRKLRIVNFLFVNQLIVLQKQYKI
jgi:SAM-dependent methyltransferase